MTDLLHDWVKQHQRWKNYHAATHELQLTPQERYAYQHHLRNLDLGGVPHDDGSLSTFLNLTAQFDDGRTYVLPTVWDNKIIGNDEAIRRARAVGLDKWPSYDTEDAAKSRYDAMHGYMERDTERRLNAHPVSKPPATPHIPELDTRTQSTDRTRVNSGR
jgi:hypothetical protein